MSGQQQKLSSCRIALQESWAHFPVKEYERILVFVAFMTPKNELLLTEDEEGKWGMPHEHFLRRDMLRSVPERVIPKCLGLDLRQVGTLGPVKLLGACEIDRDYCVVLSAKVSFSCRLSRWRFVAGTDIHPYAEQQPILTPAASHLWPQELAAA
jgi:hypothetical protein